MTPNKKLTKRLLTISISMLLALGLVFPFIATVNAAALQATSIQSDDFDRCVVDNGWEVVNTSNTPGGNPTTQGAFTSNADLQMSVPGGTVYTFWRENQNAPQIYQPASDTSFTVVTKFDSIPRSEWQMEGLLVRDKIHNRYLRFDFDNDGSGLKAYVGHIYSTTNPDSSLNWYGKGLYGPAFVGTPNPADGTPLYLKISRDITTGTWNFSYRVGSAGNYTSVLEFSDTPDTSPTGTYRVSVTDIGLFVGSTQKVSNPPAPFTMLVDYIAYAPTANADPSIANEDSATNTLTINPPAHGQITGASSGDQFTCANNQVTLNAVAAPGYSFSKWTGDFQPSEDVNASPITITMNGSRTISAEFVTGNQPPTPTPTTPTPTPTQPPQGELSLKIYLPKIIH